MRRTEYDASQAAKRLKVPAAAFRWARHTGLIPDPDTSSYQWSRTAVEALDADAIRAAMSSPPIGGGAAADRIADALGTPNVIGEKANVTAFVVRRFVDRGLLVDLSANPDGTLHHPDQVAEVCRREDLADLVAADTPLGPEQAAARLRVRRADFDGRHPPARRARQPEGLPTRSAPSPRSTTPATPSTNGILQRLDTHRAIYRPADNPEQ
ncbi:hypothetical protein [Streptomyces sp. CoT10]|uniref:hypothetical protein n=1 Tax=Streptomyces sp. CoT10 TaxID=2875762 RepID=UPI001CD2769D|nr:hypothetical protein [Streptomyces sp. CoT10]